jgi:hypothetical protein
MDGFGWVKPMIAKRGEGIGFTSAAHASPRHVRVEARRRWWEEVVVEVLGV